MTAFTENQELRKALAALSGDDFPAKARDLLALLGYRSGRRLDLSGSVEDFFNQFSPPKEGAQGNQTQSAQQFREEVSAIHLLFQLTDSEIARQYQSGLFADSGAFARGDIKSFLFFVVALRGDHYARGQYAAFTREINRRLSMPVFVLFRTAGGGHCTLAFVERRRHKQKRERDVLGSVSLISEIDLQQPHRAHIDILGELSLEERLQWMRERDRAASFESLLAAMLDTLDTEALNRRFYRELFGWFEWAKGEARFPKKEARTRPAEEHLIRLITRLLFVWFIKEKELVSGDLFIEEKIAPLLKGYDREGDSYYRAALQNLFFATLNTEIGQRDFSQESNETHRNFSRYRYKKEMKAPDTLLKLFRETPFINGGLFDCLDSEPATHDGGYRIDCFSDNARHGRDLLSLPNRLFFDEEKGLFPLFNRYKFTVEENTPAEREVALDPELLGKVFENLLAAYNPETSEIVRKQTARKQSGSYYTPRPVVEYMASEALVEYLSEKAQRSSNDDNSDNSNNGDNDDDNSDNGDNGGNSGESWRDRLRALLDHRSAFPDADDPLSEQERGAIVEAIARIRVVDPAVGSGAFPMEILRKLTLALRRLDPDNRLWIEIQRELAGEKAATAFETENQAKRDEELQEISDTFERYGASDFGRKLYLIQNSIFGVDIQPVACQIAKLRFFISLAIEQSKSADPNDNYGIRPLPNLETRFVAANTLLGIQPPANRQAQAQGQQSKQGRQMSLGSQKQIPELERQLSRNRELHFHAQTRQTKLDLRKEDERLREKLSSQLKNLLGFSADAADRIARWDPYDQNGRADWFDAEYMFGVTDGFDIVIGNPPYIQLQKSEGRLGRLYKDAGFETLTRTGDIYQLFMEQGCNLVKSKRGLLVYITSNSWLKAEYGKTTRRYFTERHTPLRLLEMGKDVFENAIVDASILIARHSKEESEEGRQGRGGDMDQLADKRFPPEDRLWSPLHTPPDRPWIILSPTGYKVMKKMESIGTPLKEWDVKINYGIKTGYNEAFIIDHATRQELIAADPKSAEIIKPLLRGRDIQRYQAQWEGFWLIDTHNGYGDVPPINIKNYPAVKAHLNSFYPQLKRRQDKGITPYNLRHCAYHEEFAKEKLFWIELVTEGRFAYDNSGIYGEATSFIMTGQNMKYLCAVLNTCFIRWFIQQVAPTSGMGTLRWKKVYVEKIPIPKIPAEQQRPFVELVDRILQAKAANAVADTAELEAEIDRLVQKLYGLTEEEIALVEGR